MQVSCSYTVNTVHILNIPGFVKCPGAGNKLTVKCPGAGNFFCANARGCPGGGMVRVGIERDISTTQTIKSKDKGQTQWLGNNSSNNSKKVSTFSTRLIGKKEMAMARKIADR